MFLGTCSTIDKQVDGKYLLIFPKNFDKIIKFYGNHLAKGKHCSIVASNIFLANSSYPKISLRGPASSLCISYHWPSSSNNTPFCVFWNLECSLNNSIQYICFFKKSRKKRNVSLGLNLWIFSLWKLIFHQWIDTRISCQFWGCDLLLGIGLLSARLSIKSHKAVMIELGGRMSGTILKIFAAE